MIDLSGVVDCDVYIRQELEEAGIEVEEIKKIHTRIPSSLIGKIGAWTLWRRRVSWRASACVGDGIPKEYAEDLNDYYFEVIRVGGMSDGCEVHEYASDRGTIGRYHIDTQEGLNAFADLVRHLDTLDNAEKDLAC